MKHGLCVALVLTLARLSYSAQHLFADSQEIRQRTGCVQCCSSDSASTTQANTCSEEQWPAVRGVAAQVDWTVSDAAGIEEKETGTRSFDGALLDLSRFARPATGHQ